MSLTSYRAAPPRAGAGALWGGAGLGRWVRSEWRCDGLGGPGGDRLSRVLRHSTMGAETFDGRVRDGIGSCRLAKATRPAKIVWVSEKSVLGLVFVASGPALWGAGGPLGGPPLGMD